MLWVSGGSGWNEMGNKKGKYEYENILIHSPNEKTNTKMVK